MMSKKCRADEPHKSYDLLEKANSCIEQTIQRTCDDDVSVYIIIAASFHSNLVILYSGKCLKLSTLNFEIF